jgi:peptidoglycan/xylan/chitin deacetylase (PgdA/CDA1 family)
LTASTHILIYHALESATEPVAELDAADRSVVVHADDFRQQLQALRGWDIPILPLQAALRSDVTPPTPNDARRRPRVVFTFDDGHRSNYSVAFPLLLEMQATATFYIIAGFVDRNPSYLTSSQLGEMAAANMNIGSHTMTHRWLPTLSPGEIRRELTDSKSRLEDLLQGPVLDLALPGGHFNRAVWEAAREAGYRSVATSKAGVYRTGDNSHRLPRIEIRRGLSLPGFRRRFQRGTLWKLQAAEFAKSCVRSTLGLTRYTALRSYSHHILSSWRS